MPSHTRTTALAHALTEAGPLRFTDDPYIVEQYARELERQLAPLGWRLYHENPNRHPWHEAHTPQNPNDDDRQADNDPWPSVPTEHRWRAILDRVDAIETRTQRLEDNTFGSADRLAYLEAVRIEDDARISAVELLTHTTTELAREIHTMRNTIQRHRTELDYLAGELDTLPPAHDPDTQLGGHDNPNPNYHADDQTTDERHA